MTAQVRSVSVQVGFVAASSRIRGSQVERSLRSTSRTIVGLEVAPVAPRATAYSSSSTAHESFQNSVGRPVTVRASGPSIEGRGSLGRHASRLLGAMIIDDR